jgi:hypothetical protein
VRVVPRARACGCAQARLSRAISELTAGGDAGGAAEAEMLSAVLARLQAQRLYHEVAPAQTALSLASP